jgi:hypothetical protein
VWLFKQVHNLQDYDAFSHNIPIIHILLRLTDVLKFTGPGPELINGRLAMLAFLAVPRNEIETGATVLQQAVSAPWWVYAALLLWVYASMVPLLKGARHEAFGELLLLLLGGCCYFCCCCCCGCCSFCWAVWVARKGWVWLLDKIAGTVCLHATKVKNSA